MRAMLTQPVNLHVHMTVGTEVHTCDALATLRVVVAQQKVSINLLAHCVGVDPQLWSLQNILM